MDQLAMLPLNCKEKSDDVKTAKDELLWALIVTAAIECQSLKSHQMRHDQFHSS